ncbi:MAG: hypothetical protein H6923_10980 [Alphaproteobacteria bacterium]|nr:hypothetical protein [Alphaproteobacteria bacterium]
MTLYRIRMEQARGKDRPEGEAGRGYEFIAPLARDGTLDPEAWKAAKAICTVRRFAPDGADEHGHLAHGRWGWRFHYDGALEGPVDDEEEPIFRLDAKRLAVGEYLAVAEEDGRAVTFRIVSVTKSPLA